jgi:hypothetical protein
VTEVLFVVAYILVGVCVAGYVFGRFDLTPSEDSGAVPPLILFWPFVLLGLVGGVFFRLGRAQSRKHEA